MCGIVGVYGDEQAASTVALALFRLQHRGQATAGIVASDNGVFSGRRDRGLVTQVLTPAVCAELKGNTAIGHVRYPTSGSKESEHVLRDAGPLSADLPGGSVAVAHNGNIDGIGPIREQLLAENRTFLTGTDTELFLHMIASARGDSFHDRLTEALRKVPIAYAIVVLTRHGLFAARDPKGIRPLVFGRRANGAWVFASETVALDIVGATFEREVEPGEIISIGPDGFRSSRFSEPELPRPCIFEHVYFSNPASENGLVHFARVEAGRVLARNHGILADIVLGVPDSGLAAAFGYAEEAGLPLMPGIVRNHYSGRSFIESSNDKRITVARFKHIINKKIVAGKRIALIDDSVVRGNTLPQVIELLREGGAAEVHVRIPSPPFAFPCRYGIDTPTREELLAFRFPDEASMAAYLRADTLAFLSGEELIEAVHSATGKSSFCTACFDGRYLHPRLANPSAEVLV